MRTVLALMNRNRKLFFKDKGMLFTSMITPVILIGETLSWEYLCYVRNHPVNWSVPTYILYGDKDNLSISLPYEGAKEMLLVEDVDSKEYLAGLFKAMYDELPVHKSNNKIRKF